MGDHNSDEQGDRRQESDRRDGADRRKEDRFRKGITKEADRREGERRGG